jgi:predicted RND superfamily exporter protein
VAAGHAVQILKRYYEEYARGFSSPEAVVRSLMRVGPVTVTAGTIASAGFGSLATFGVASVRVFGLTLALGIISSLIIEMTFIPACRVLLPAPRDRETIREGGGRWFRRLLEWVGHATTEHPKVILGVAAALVGIFLIGATRLRVDNSFHAWFPENSRIRVDDRLLNERLAGTSTLYVLLQGDDEGAITNPAVLRALGDMEKWLTKQPGIGASLSLYDYVEHMHTVMTGETALPDDQALIEQYLFLYSMSGPDQLSSFIDPAHRNTVLRAYAKTDEAEYGGQLLAGLQQFARSRFKDLPVKVRVAGGALGVQSALNEVVVREKIVNILQVGAIILLLSSLALRSPVGGLLVITPLVVAVVINLGVMGYSQTWLSVGTSTVSAMAVSIGADFAIYLIYRIREELRSGADLVTALRRSLQTAGGAICFVASAVVLGYLVLSLSGFRLWVHLGALTALMMMVSALAALTIIPSVVMIVRPRFLLAQRGAGVDSDVNPGAPSARYAFRPPNP